MSFDGLKESLSLPGHTKAIRCLTSFHYKDSQVIASGGEDGLILLWDFLLDPNYIVCTLKNESTIWALVAIKNENNDYLASSYLDKIKIWQPSAKLDPILVLSCHQLPVVCLHSRVLEDGSLMLFSGSYDYSIKVWKPFTNTTFKRLSWTKNNDRLVTTIIGHEQYVTCLTTFKMNNEILLASGSSDKTIKVWTLCSWENLITLKEDKLQGVYSLCTINYKGVDVLVSAGFEKVIRVWDPNLESENKVIMKLDCHNDIVWNLNTFEMNSQTYIISGSEDNYINIWNLNIEDPLIHCIYNRSIIYSAIFFKLKDEVAFFSNDKNEIKMFSK